MLDGVDDQQAFTRKTGEKQDMEDLKKRAKFAWLAPYCTLYSCSTDTEQFKQQMAPFKTFRLGGDVSQVFDPQKPSDG